MRRSLRWGQAAQMGVHNISRIMELPNCKLGRCGDEEQGVLPGVAL